MRPSRTLAVIFVALGAVFACSSSFSAAEELTLSTYLQIDPANSQSAGYNETIKAFEAAHPEITFAHEYATGEAFHQKFQAMAASRQIPDVVTTYVGKRTAYITETGMVMDLRPYLSDDFKSQYNPAAWEPQGPNGEIYTIPPSMAVCHVMYANTALLKKLGLEFPKTYQELLDQVEPIRAAGYYPVSMGNKDQWVVNSWLLSALVDRLGGKEWFNKAMSGEAKFTDNPFVRALEIVDEMVKKNVFSPGVNQMSNTEADQEFYQQKSVYLIDAGWRTSAMISELPPEQQDAIYMGVFPAIEGEVSPNSSAAVPSEGFGISAAIEGTPKADAAWEFISFYAGQEGSAIRVANGEIPTYKLDYSTIEMPKLQKAYAEFSISHPMGYIIDAKMDPEGMGVLNPDIQAMMFGQLTPQQVAERYEAWVAENDSNRMK
ncbi:ABC transporter substrate-binding protein [candidate division KSB3 bacterium]|uniref:ABC transporter substrate-binding protein n=1 Tax=candidate division KSB3 bacterium TaxID=2044937 RepID=A0A2G6E1J6_9BACT|nr:MAG: ABC transporter substrate-binding protein [candidate division KSB3 bacterium]PIE28584.1 MAG: ABC transporter substrate-binding protein [candidate division KSB3 bacterium]